MTGRRYFPIQKSTKIGSGRSSRNQGKGNRTDKDGKGNRTDKDGTGGREKGEGKLKTQILRPSSPQNDKITSSTSICVHLCPLWPGKARYKIGSSVTLGGVVLSSPSAEDRRLTRSPGRITLDVYE